MPLSNYEVFKDWEQVHKWAKVRWEFMRRSPEYREDYEKAQKLRSKISTIDPTWKDVVTRTGTYIYPEGFENESEEEAKKHRLC